MGSLYVRNGVFYGDYIDPRSKRRRQVSLRTRDRVVAKARLRDFELATTDSGPHPSQSLADALDWFTGTVHVASPIGTQKSYKQKARHLVRLMGDVGLDDLTRDRALRYIATRTNEGAHPHTIHKELVVLRGALKAAAERTPKLFHGQVKSIVPEWDAQYEPRRTALTPEQFMALTTHLVPVLSENARPEAREVYEARRQRRVLACMLIAFASPRLGELGKMTWQDHIDLRRNLIHVPKAKTVWRPVAIAAELRPWLEHFGDAANWTGPVCEPWGNCRRDLDRACKRAGIPKVTPNDLRRTFSSWLVNAGESLFVVATLLGHSSTRMVEKVYGRLTPATLANAIAKLPGASAPVSDCHAGVTLEVPNTVTGGANDTGSDSAVEVVSRRETRNSGVPRDGVEPPTRGFSVRCSTS